VTINSNDERTLTVLTERNELLRRLARITAIEIDEHASKPKLSATEVVRGAEIHVHLEGLIDLDKERQKTEKEISRLEGQLRGIEAKLSNERFVANAPSDVVEREREKLQSFRETIDKLQETMKSYAG
jgi:valyl-tRNA synthetase